MRNYAKLNMRNYAKLCETMRNYAKLCETMRNYAKLCETMRNYAKLGPAQDPWPPKPVFQAEWIGPSDSKRNNRANSQNQYKTKSKLLDLPFYYSFIYLYVFYEKGLLPYWRQGIYDQLIKRIRDSLSNIFSFQNKSVNSWTCPHVARPKNTFIWQNMGLEYDKSGNQVPYISDLENKS